ncbi:MAG: NAD(+) diphosphatase [Syntrophobacterales bacterium]|jgi:NAD+ diphosphatase|nr:NAD(+) diphosphatase [Syntrophobacterales bacterium]
MNGRFIPSAASPPEKKEQAWWFIFRTHKMVTMENEAGMSVPFITGPAAMGLHALSERYLGTLDGRHCYCAEVGESGLPEGAALHGLRYLFEHLDKKLHRVAMRAVHLIEWDKNERFCGRCGHATNNKMEMNAKECPRCRHVTFPRISPAVIVLVEKEGKLLLARASRFAEEMYSVLAGFVEPGETLEETVRREIEEEVGIKVWNIRYFGSQPWPFPDSLMIGFTAEYESGELKIDGSEIERAAWFDPEALPLIPGKISIARELIDWFVERKPV